ncbi:SDR family NAD(P)-dependent oxidoreductase [Methylobacterium sp. NEAU 140]|uniref:SDR family NAD(P)-dependent oxidoreductase n=1 Tax=Methylobacterium sp. NEAU 140 TaxID=3064945 RepID=UPI002735B893|nr:SDR family NAD(P)-dependent oxidoreductase [Methylobacterium sp. NEAU 140]MDP4026485.1 SDR family NAD(P)-dependent oxidoreductase [Methylobacterium sp. NEAU 140]
MTRAQYDFSGKVAVVTGGARGIGRAVAERLHAAGATLSVWDLAATARGLEDATSYQVDVFDLSAVEAASTRTLAMLGKIDILVHCAGFAGETVRLEETDPSAWRRIVEVNLVGTYNVCRAVVPAMRAAGTGRIIPVASLAGKEGTPNASAYSAAKAGVIALTKSLGKELAGSGVVVNAIAPAAVSTAILDQMSPAHVQTMIEKSPLGRLGSTDEVAEMVLWLASESCSFNIGAVFDLSGGRATY